METNTSRRKYFITIGVLGGLTILMSLGKSEGELFDKVLQGIGGLIAGFAIGLLTYPLVWLLKRKSERKFEICLVIGALLALVITVSSL